MQILKRPANLPHTNPSSGINSEGNSQSLAEREAAYAAARCRIFNEPCPNTIPSAPQHCGTTVSSSMTLEGEGESGKGDPASGVV